MSAHMQSAHADKQRRFKWPASGKAGSWYLVLCHERCFKEEFTERRVLLSSYVTSNRGTLLCIRKSSNLKTWLRSNSKPYALITGWREAKPSSEVTTSCPPEAFFVLADLDTSFTRASEWVAKNGTPLLRSLESITNELSETVARLTSLNRKSKPEAMPSRSSPGEEGIPLHLANALSLGLPCKEEKLGPKTASKQSPFPSYSGLSTAACAADRSDALSRSPLDLDLLSKVREFNSLYRNEVEAMLLEAMPTSYED
eukprot:TRINITY_DN15260_c0_g1_i1.p1 TRINITY_DN15260_c0_g1~~TRINITY_DN15260_c0_g1_i1.p1  ORF type:complete len:256 (+),score=39.14 TRINITY_DN15260_c0_g1_i1:115-882(+)